MTFRLEASFIDAGKVLSARRFDGFHVNPLPQGHILHHVPLRREHLKAALGRLGVHLIETRLPRNDGHMTCAWSASLARDEAS